jgi:YfiH family protein
MGRWVWPVPPGRNTRTTGPRRTSSRDINLQNTQTIPAVKSSALLTAAGFRHAFFTRHGGVSSGAYSSLNFSITVGDDPRAVEENLARAAAHLGVAPHGLYFLSQVHGSVVLALGGDEAPKEVVYREGDAIVCSNSDVAIGVRMADCVPILVGDTRTGAALAIHAGWKGLVAGVIEAGITALRARGASASDLIAAVGPHIGLGAFEVSEDVAATLAALAPDVAIVDRALGPKPRVNLLAVTMSKLRVLGLRETHIEAVPGCTVSEPADFFSFRRDGAKSGRHLAAIVPR